RLATCRVQVQLPPRVAALPTLLLLVMVRSGAVTVTESLKPLFASLLSTMMLAGSTEALPPERGLLKAPMAVALAVKTASKLFPGCRVTVPLAEMVRLLALMEPLR